MKGICMNGYKRGLFCLAQIIKKSEEVKLRFDESKANWMADLDPLPSES